MITIEAFILARSSLPKDGTHSMDEHLVSMTMYVAGLEAKLHVVEVVEETLIEETTESVVVSDTDNGIEVSSLSDVIIVNEEGI